MIPALIVGCALLAAAWLALWADTGAPVGKSGGSPPTALKLVVVERQDTPAARIAERFARRVEADSNGSMGIEIVYWPTRFRAATPGRRIAASAIRAVRSNATELGLFPSHALQAQGATTFQALEAPFLISSASGAARATTGSIAVRLQAGLPRISLAGLALVPEGLYRPFGYLKPLLTPADFAGVTIRADRDGATSNLLRMLGAHPVDAGLDSGDTAVHSGFVSGAESATTADDVFPQSAYTTGNIALFPKVDVLVASKRAFGRLRGSQREILREAAAVARAEAIAAGGESGLAAYCRDGGTIVRAPASALRALQAKAAPLLARMRRDPETSSVLAAIERLGLGPATTDASCASTEARPPAGPVYGDFGNVERDALLPPAGSFRRAFTDAELQAAGADEATVARNRGVTALTLHGPGHALRFVVEWPGSSRPSCRGSVELTASRLAELHWNPATPCSGYVAFAWRSDGHDLVIEKLGARTEPRWIKELYPGTWKRVDCEVFTGEAGFDPDITRPCLGPFNLRMLPASGRDSPVFSPDGKRLVFETRLPGRYGLVIAKADGSDVEWLTGDKRAANAWPVFSPDGMWIAFIRFARVVGRGRGVYTWALAVVGADGAGFEQLTPAGPPERIPAEIRWSPKGSRSVYVIRSNGGHHLSWQQG